MTLLNEDADDASSVGSDGSNVAPGLVFAHKRDDVSGVEEQECGSVCLPDCVCAAGSGAVIRNYIARYVLKSFVSHAAWAAKFLQLNKSEKVPILMDSKTDKVCGQVGADRFNEIRLQELAGRTGKPVISFGAHHGKSENQPALKGNLLDPENVRETKIRESTACMWY